MPARLVCQTGELAGSHFFIEQEATIGRRPDNDITLAYQVVSSHHARIYFDPKDGCYFLEDLGSFNGTKIDGVRITSATRLCHGQTITFAEWHDFIFQHPSSSEIVPPGSRHDSTILASDLPGPADRSPPWQTPTPLERSSAMPGEQKSVLAWLTRDVIQSIIDRDNLVVRNLQVTQGYYRLSEGMRWLIGGRNASWCSFAAHASKTAGQALRHELMPRLLKSAMIRLAGYDSTYVYLNDVLDRANQVPLGEKESRLAEAMRRVSLLVSEGNIIVFAELAWPFVRFIDAFSEDRAFDGRKLDAFLQQHFRPGPLDQGGQDYLIEAFSAYYHARYETDAKRKAEYVLQGNLLVGLHEQTRLQSQIEQALAVPLTVFSDRASQDERGRARRRLTTRRMQQLVTRATTQMLMLITLPSRELRLSQDVVAPTGVDSFPSDLLAIQNSRCLELVRMFEDREDTLTGSAAHDWVSLQERMRFVVDFFRSHQQYDRLWEPPFLTHQMPAIEAGYLPAGPL